MSKPPRPALRFGLRTLLVLMLLASAFCGGWAANEWKHRAELERTKAEAERTLEQDYGWRYTINYHWLERAEAERTAADPSQPLAGQDRAEE